jgi:FecR protein
MRAPRRFILATLIVTLWSFFSMTAVAQNDPADQPMETPMPQQAPPPPDGAQANQQYPGPGGPMAQGPGRPDAGQQDQNRDDNDPPGRVARLQFMNGSVSIQPAGTGDWVQGAVNRPLTNADNVWADKNSRAELNLGTGIFRIGAESSLTLTNVNENTVQVSLHQGTLNAHVRHLFDGETYEIDTPNQAFTILRTGDYRFDVDPNGDATVVTVWKGEGEATGDGPKMRVKAHTQARFTNGNSMTVKMNAAPDPDSFDEWCESRDRRIDSSRSSQYVSPDVIGSEDLDNSGTWRNTQDYGNVWVPSDVGADWAPYTNGNWIYQDPWGWTWQDYAPWGFAPFHYGRWVSFGGYWGWAPGPYYGGWGRAFYAPALVSWYGGGFGFGIGFGGFGWCPLGFGEPFFPWYHYGWGYFRGVNIYNSRFNNFDRFHAGFNNGWRGGDWQRRSVNFNARGGFHAVSRNTMEHGLAVNHNALHVSASGMRDAHPLDRVNANPSRDSRLGGRAGVAAPQRSLSRPTVSRMARPSSPSRMGGNEAGSFHNQAEGGRNVPRPPAGSASNRGDMGRNEVGRGESSVNSRSVPRSSENSNSAQGRVNHVPRPTGRVLPAPRSYSSDSGRGTYSSRSYGESSGRYGQSSRYGGSSYGRPSYSGRGYGGSPYGGSRGGSPYGGYSGHSSPAPSHGGSAPHSSGGGGGSHGGGSASSHGSSGGHGGGGGGGHSGGGGGHKGHR